MASARLARAVDAFRGSFLQLAALVLTGIASIIVLCVARVEPTALPLFTTWPSGAANTTADARAVVVGGIGVCARLSNQTATTEGASVVQAGPFICAERLFAGITEPLPNTAAGDVVTALASTSVRDRLCGADLRQSQCAQGRAMDRARGLANLDRGAAPAVERSPDPPRGASTSARLHEDALVECAFRRRSTQADACRS